MTLDATDKYPNATYVSDPRYAKVSIQALIDENAAAEEDDQLVELFVADATAMTAPSQPLLAVDLCNEPGRTFRVPVPWYAEISANMDFADHADAADESSTFRGFGEG
ncbi:DUF6924 domain-containing protein [Streptomyces sp. NPDC057543]|uniref:DUF6924 domain-containing protein n=1 Tax=Streptomyces sp. NPDC057543 TaxID=3346163 RepID=UPI0036B02C45